MPTRAEASDRGIDSELFADAGSDRKAEILSAALSVFAESGYDGGSMREIAKRVGVTEPALYRHFPSKEAMFLALVREVGARVHSRGFALIESVRPESLRDQLAAAFADRRLAVRVYAPLLRTLLSAASRNPKVLEEYRATLLEPLRAALVEKAAELDVAFGMPDEANASREERVRALMALVVGYMVSSLVLADTPDAAVADAAIRVMGWEDAS